MVEWDNFSDQPSHMRDKKFKRDIRKKYLGDIVFSLITIILIYPVVLIRYLFGFKKNRDFNLDDFFGMSVNLDKNPDICPKLIGELGVKSILIRVPLSEINDIDKYVTFAKSFKNKKIFFVIIQDRNHICNEELLKKDVYTLFKALCKYSINFQVGNAINRMKWGFALPKEYLIFYKVVQKVKDTHFKQINLIGPSVIDFEYHVTIRAVFNFFSIKYNGLSSLLYVDRRGAPENKQFIFNLVDKINLLKAISVLSPKIKSNNIYITETNWPIKDTGKYAPTSNYERIDETLYMIYMVRYYLLAISTTHIKTIYWHQLIAPGYGLVDNRDGIRKRDAFFAFKFMNNLLNNAKFISYSQNDEMYKITFKKSNKMISVLWTNGTDATYKLCDKSGIKIFDILGKILEPKNQLMINGSIKYIMEDME